MTELNILSCQYQMDKHLGIRGTIIEKLFSVLE